MVTRALSVGVVRYSTQPVVDSRREARAITRLLS